MTLEKGRLLMKTFVFSQFNYCSLACICGNRKLNKLNILQERPLFNVYTDKCSAFYQFLENDKSVTVLTSII